MATVPLLINDLLDPISPDQAAGVDLRWTPEWDRLKEARRSDDGLESGKWAKKERKTADWPLVQQLATSMLKERSKDVQLAMWLTEANIKLHGFAGLRDSLRLTRELIGRYWDQGLYPAIEDGPEDRAGPLEWLNDKLVDSIVAIPITARADQGHDYSLMDLQEARRVGSESGFKNADADIVDENRKKNYDAAVAAGRVSMDMFEKAVKESKRAAYEELNADLQQICDELKALDKILDEKFGDAVPNLSSLRTALNDIREEVSHILDKKRADEPGPIEPAVDNAGSEQQPKGSPEPVVLRFPLSLSNSGAPQVGGAGSWQEAEALIRSGRTEQGLAEMTRIAVNETCGRDRFQRKLLLAEVCLTIKREHLARLILDELAEQIDTFHLELWERPDLVGGVWARLYTLCKQEDTGSTDQERAAKLYERLCRLDPWQALSCG